MYLEQEAYGTLLWAFIIVMAISAVFLTYLYLTTRNRGLLWFGGQLVLTSFAFSFFYRAIKYLPNQANAMYSEDQSLHLALAGLFWAAGVFFMLAGVNRLIKQQSHV